MAFGQKLQLYSLVMTILFVAVTGYAGYIFSSFRNSEKLLEPMRIENENLMNELQLLEGQISSQKMLIDSLELELQNSGALVN